MGCLQRRKELESTGLLQRLAGKSEEKTENEDSEPRVKLRVGARLPAAAEPGCRYRIRKFSGDLL